MAAHMTAFLLAIAAAAGGDNSTLDAKGSGAEKIEGLWWFMLVAATVAVAVVIVLTLIAILRREDSRLDRFAGRLGGRGLVAVGGLVIPIAVLCVLFVLTVGTLDATAPGKAPPALTVQVTGAQWFWKARYPGGAVTANEIHIPTGASVNVAVTSRDVLHSFWVPSLNRKIDLVPGRTNHVTLETDDPGTYRGFCAEFCGLQHANMGFLVIAEPPASFERWLAGQRQPSRPPTDPLERQGERVFIDSGCAGCHTIRGTAAAGDVGPDLTHLRSRRTLAGATIDNTRGNLAGWFLDPQHIKPGVRMPGTDLSGPQTQAILAYLRNLR